MQHIYRRITNEETETKIAQYNVEYETEKKEQLIATQQNDLEKTRYLTIFVSIVAILLLISVITSFRNYKTKKQVAVKEAIQKQKDNNIIAVFQSEQTERIRIARDLHDSIGQKLSVLKIYLNNRANDEVKTPQLLDETIQEVRNISHNLLPEELNFGFINTLKSDIDKMKSTGAFNLNTQIKDADYQKLSLLTTLNIVRIFREILSNITNHSKATEISINIFMENEALHLEITDDGVGLNQQKIDQSNGIGWKNIFTRTNMLKGKIKITETYPGTRIKIEIPES